MQNKNAAPSARGAAQEMRGGEKSQRVNDAGGGGCLLTFCALIGVLCLTHSTVIRFKPFCAAMRRSVFPFESL
jgi:hypothetical protein